MVSKNGVSSAIASAGFAGALILLAACSASTAPVTRTCPQAPQVALESYTIATVNGPEPGPILPAGEYSTAATELYFTTTSTSVGIFGGVVLQGSDGTTIDASYFGAQGVVPSGGGATIYSGYDAGIANLEANVTYTVLLTNVTYGDDCRESNQTIGTFTTN